ncbi:mediator of RNA polymerase II transcription subunit 13 [Cydia amplana]|uniref:mediator of RNA polymerase II transcription subunit 13 n=1 Tax=Cydia amplana TaxID=1869771 RepID=UPI002FE68CAF
MTHQNHQTNGASLEDCHTNFFSLTELYGIKWRKLVWGETTGGGGEGEEGAAPLADPVISSYARCLAGDILCVWRRVPAPQPQDIYEMSAPPAPPPPLSLRAAKELWIFWYGEEPDLNGLVAPELIAGQGDQGSWESGLSYECRSLLFKALHNLIERCLLSRDFVRLGKWFVQPYDGDEEDVGKSPWHLSFSFAFFLHGESTVCASVDVRQHPPVRTLTAKRLAKLNGRERSADADNKVILAPFGLEGTVTGRDWSDSDAPTGRLLDAWRQLYPLEQGCGAVEVVCGGVRMRYPLPYVLVTGMEPPPAPPPAPPLAAAAAAALTTPKPHLPAEVCYAESGDKGDDFVDPTRKTPCTCAKWRRRRGPRPAPFHRRRLPDRAPHKRHPGGGSCGAAALSPGSCAGSPLPAGSAPPSAGAPHSPHPHPHHTPQQATLPHQVCITESGALPPTTLHTPAPTPETHAPPTPAPPSAPPPTKLYPQLLKRPVLPRGETRVDPLEDEHSLHMLYDYTTVHAWLEHPVKRFKSDENTFREELALGSTGGDLYAGHDHTRMAVMPDHADVKHDHDDAAYKNLYTSDGLCPTLKDLDQIFENSDDAASGDETVRLLQVQTPPDSNKSFEETRGRMVRAEELSKMFPTPPSLEAHAAPSPGFTLELEPLRHAHSHAHPHLTPHATPPHEPIEDWSYVFKPPTVYKCVGSSKYAPLLSLPSSSLPPVTLPPHAVYRPRWQQSEEEPQPQTVYKCVGSSKYAPLLSLPSSSLPPVTLPPHAVYRPRWQQSEEEPQPQTVYKCVGSSKYAPLLSLPSSSLPPVTLPPHAVYRPRWQQSEEEPQPQTGTKRPLSPAGAPAATPAGAAPSPLPRPAPAPAPPPPRAASPAPASPAPRAACRACPLLLNVLLADTVLNVFRDHNFDSCTLCVCNAGPKVVGNIRGADASTYLPETADAADEDPGRCTCGFSAVVNRRLAHKAGLFYEDEMEITGIAEIPARGGARSLGAVAGAVLGMCAALGGGGASALSRAARHQARERHDQNDVNLLESCVIAEIPARGGARSLGAVAGAVLGMCAALGGGGASALSRAARHQARERHDQNDVNLLESCVIAEIPARGGARSLGAVAGAVLGMCAALGGGGASALSRAARHQARERHDQNDVNLLEYADGGAACLRALRAAGAGAGAAGAGAGAGAVHRWPFIGARAPRCSRDVIRLMRRLRPLLQDAIQKRCCGARMWDGVAGPLTWRQFHRLAGRSNEDLCEPQPVPPLLVGHDRDWISLSPYALRHWERLSLEPYSYSRDVAYVVLAADGEFLTDPIKTFFRELSTAYESCRLGRHQPINRIARDGLIRTAPSDRDQLAEEWTGELPAGRLGEYIKSYAETLRTSIVPQLASLSIDRSLLETETKSAHIERPAPSPMRPPSTPDHPPTPSSQSDQENETPNMSSSTNNSTVHNSWEEEEGGAPALVIYVVEPPAAHAHRAHSLHALLRLAARAHHHLRHHNPLVKIISLEGVCETAGLGAGTRSELRALAFSVFTGARRLLQPAPAGKSLTGFGTAAQARVLIDAMQEKDRAPYKLFSPAWVLAPPRALKEVAETWGHSCGEQGSVLFLSYCLSHDQRWLLAAATDARGELLDTHAVNIHVPHRSRRRRALGARRCGLTKLMDWALGVMSRAAQPWRLVVGRLGRIGHGELKGWSWLLSRKNLTRASNQLKDICNPCSVLYPSGAPCILSACLVSTEPDSCLRLMADRFTPDERFSQASIQSHLHTPRDVTATHILVFPTSATATQVSTVPSPTRVCGSWRTGSPPTSGQYCAEPDSCLRLMADRFTPDERFSQASIQSHLHTPRDVTATHILVFPTSATATQVSTVPSPTRVCGSWRTGSPPTSGQYCAEPDSCLRLMADRFTPDERFSQASIQSHLHTPRDVTATHILVFPTSATATQVSTVPSPTRVCGSWRTGSPPTSGQYCAEPDSCLRLMADRFTPDERFSQASIQSHLHTPRDVTATHILVFPTSATATQVSTVPSPTRVCGSWRTGSPPTSGQYCAEPDSCLRLMADRFTPDERFSQASIQSHLHTPRDVTATHILVFPTSATATQSAQGQFEQSAMANGETDDMMFLGVDMNDMNDDEIGDSNMTDLLIGDMFNNMWPQGSPRNDGGREEDAAADEDEPQRLGDMFNNMWPQGSPRNDGGREEDAAADEDEPQRNVPQASYAGDDHSQEQVGTVLQQPLALGYMVSTAPLDAMPAWWWAGCPHLRDACPPAFLKNALHLHTGSVQAADDFTSLTQRSSHVHPLDSQVTTDVLRYVLEGYNALSWLALDGETHDRRSCLPLHVQVLMQLYHTAAALG